MPKAPKKKSVGLVQGMAEGKSVKPKKIRRGIGGLTAEQMQGGGETDMEVARGANKPKKGKGY